MTPDEAGSAASRRWAIVAVIIVILVVGIAGTLYFRAPESTTTTSSSSTSTTSTTTSSSTTTPPSGVMVLVFGIVGTTGNGTHPISMDFTSMTTSAAYIAPVSSGHFSIQLPNQDTYNVTMVWGGNYTWQQGEAAAGTFTINMSGSSNLGESYNIVLPTPDSVVRVSGSVAWQVVTSTPTLIRFIASDGENFTATLSSDGGHTFTLPLPNMMDYKVYILSQNSTGYQEWYSAHNMAILAGVNVVGLQVKIPL